MRWIAILLCASFAIADSGISLEVILPPDSTPFRGPQAMATGMLETLYIADTGHHRLVALDSTGKIIHESSQGGSTGELRWPEDVTVGAGGKVFVADAGNRRVVEYSRLLEWKGELFIKDQDNQNLEPRRLCASTRGDLFVYENDNGQLLRYDQFYAIASRLGSQNGKYFSRPISALEFSPLFGVLWIEDGGDKIYQSDPFLSEVRPLKLVGSQAQYLQIAVVDSCLFAMDTTTLWRWASDMRDSVMMSTLGISDFDSESFLIEAASPTRLYLLDRRAGSLYRLNWP